MNPESRHRVVHSLSLSLLQQQVTALLREGWTTVGVPALAQPVDRSCPAYWVQALYLQARPSTDPGVLVADLPGLPESNPA